MAACTLLLEPDDNSCIAGMQLLVKSQASLSNSLLLVLVLQAG
jgi:hypothetical protein